MKRITSVDFLARKLQPLISFDTETARAEYRRVLEEALEKHQDEIREAYNAGTAKYLRTEPASSLEYYNDKFETNS